VAQSRAREDGDSRPYDIRAVRTGAALAERATGGVTRLASGPGPAVYLLAMRGRFTCGICTTPPGAGTPRGSVITLELLSPGERSGSKFFLGDRYPDLAAAGKPVALSGASVQSTTTQRLPKDACDEPLLPGEPAPACAPPPPGGSEGTRLLLDRDRAGRVFLRASASIADTAGAGTDATLECAVYLDGRTVAGNAVSVPGGRHRQVTIALLVRVPAGRHTVVLEADEAEFSSREPGEALVSGSSLVALTVGGG
jgi:hypothetical protein